MIPSTTPFNPGDKVVAYCRYSEGDDQGNRNTSTEEQEYAIRDYCVAHDLKLVKVFADPFASGRSVAKRQNYLEMLSYLLRKKKPDIQGVILWDYERYGRNYDRAQYDAAQLRMKGYKLFSMQQPIIDNTPFSHVLEAMYFASAQNQSDMISADVRRALQSNFTKHKCIPKSNIPVGWIPVPVKMGYYRDGTERIGHKAEPNPKYKKKIAEAVQMRLRGYSVADIRDHLSGLVKTTTQVNLMLEKTLLYGAMTYGGTVMDDYCEPIIDKETWDRLQLYIASEPKRRRSPGGGVYAKNRSLLSGLLVCGICGERMHLDTRKAKGHTYATYYCNSYHIGIRREAIDDLILEKAIDLLSGQEWENTVEAIIDELQDEFEQTHDKSDLENDIAEIDRKLARLTDALAETDTPPRTLVAKMMELENRRAFLAEQTAADTMNIDKIRSITEKIRHSVRSTLESSTASVDEKREALTTFISEIVVLPGCKLVVKHGLPGYVSVADRSGGNLRRPSKTYFTLATTLTYQRYVKRQTLGPL